MALDTTVGGVSADSYGTVAEADAYFASRDHIDHWQGSTEHKEAYLRAAAMYLDNVYRGRWKGQKASREQALAWPRTWVVDVDGYSVSSDEIPVEIKRAQFHAACLFLNATDLEAPIERAVKSESIDVISVTYMDGAGVMTQYLEITNWLGGLINGAAGVNASFGIGKVIRS